MKDILSKTKAYPRKRLVAVYDLCKSRKVCEGGDEMDTKLGEEAQDGDQKKVRKSVQEFFVHSLRLCCWAPSLFILP